MAKRKKKKTKAQIAYEKKRKVINQYKRRHKSDIELPKTPYQALGTRDISAKDYRQFTKELQDFERAFKEYIQQTEPRKKRKKADETVDFADVVIENFKQEVLKWGKSKMGSKLIQWTDETTQSYGKIKTANMLNEGKASGVVLTWQVMNYEEAAAQFISDSMSFLRENNVSSEILDELIRYAEENEDFYYE